jgi:phosphoglucomutase
VYSISTKINEYDLVSGLECDISKIGQSIFTVNDRELIIEIIDSVQDYLELMKTIFDFDALRNFFKSGVKITVNALNGIMGPYVKRILCQELGNFFSDIC